MVTAAVFDPPEVGWKQIVKIVSPPPGIVDKAGCSTMANCDASVPDRETLGVSVKVSSPEPVFWIVNSTSVPVSPVVRLPKLYDLVPSGMSVVAWRTFISGKGIGVGSSVGSYVGSGVSSGVGYGVGSFVTSGVGSDSSEAGVHPAIPIIIKHMSVITINVKIIFFIKPLLLFSLIIK
jgi:hypothetical protein